MHLALHSVNLLFKKAIFNEKKQGKAKLHKDVAENQQVLWSIESKLGNFGSIHHQYVRRRSGKKYISKGL